MQLMNNIWSKKKREKYSYLYRRKVKVAGVALAVKKNKIRL